MKILNFRFLIATLCLLVLQAGAYAQQNTIRGKVTDASDAPLPGVSVIVTGTTKGTVTDNKGEYSITAAANQSLSFSFVGYLQQTKEIGTNRTINVKMEETGQAIDDVVVIGYGTAKRGDLTGSVASVQAADIERMPVASAAEAITGKLAGVQVTKSEGEPGAEINIVVRGGTSINTDNTPLYVIDGFPSDLGLEGVDPNDILSIDVLKDASATAIYGARGSNGVINVTTKSGREGNFKVNYHGRFGISKIKKELPVGNGYDYVTTLYERRVRANMLSPDLRVVEPFGDYADFYANYANAPSVNWQDEVFGRTATTQMHNVSVSGGSKATTYTFSYSRNDDEGILNDSKYVRNTFKFNFKTKANKKVTFSASGQYMNRQIYGNGTSDVADASTVYSQLMHMLQYRPVNTQSQSLDDLIDQEFDDTDPGNSGYRLNPLQVTESIEKQRIQNTMQFNASLDYRIIKPLVFRSVAGYQKRWDNINTWWNDNSSYAIKAGGPSGQIDEANTDKWNWSNTLSYSNTFSKKHNVSVMVGQEASELTYWRGVFTDQGFENSDMKFNNLKAGKTKEMSSDAYRETMLSFFGRATYNYKSRYYLTLSMRADGSSKFAPGNQWGYFPSASGSWRMSEESFFKPLKKVIEDFKVRAGYGAAGNCRIKNFQYSANFSTTYYPINNVNQLGVYSSALANPDLTWESTYSTNLGIDFTLLRSRLSGSVDLYDIHTNDLLMDATIPNMSGYSTQTQNIGKTRNRGVEVVLNGVLISKKDLHWTANFNISFNRGKVIGLAPGETFMLKSSGWGTVGTDYIVQVGQPVGMIYGYKTDGMYTGNDFIPAVFDPTAPQYGKFIPDNLKEGVPYNDSQGKEDNLLGLPKIKRIGSPADSKTTTASLDRTILGNTNPKHFGGFGTQIRYKNVDLSVDLNWKYGNMVYNATRLRANTLTYNNQNAWKVKGQRYTVVDPLDGSPILNLDRMNEVNAKSTEYVVFTKCEILTDDYVEDGSFLRLSNVTVGYTFPTSLTKKIKIDKIRLYAAGSNLWIWTNYSGYDPEVNTRRNLGGLTQGCDYSAYPRSYNISFGVQATF